MRKVDMLVIHCTDSPHSMRVDIDTIREWHTAEPPKGNGWSDVGYHWYIDQLGDVHGGRKEEVPGAHAKGFNSRSIGICLEGRNEFTEHQFNTLRWLITDIVSRYGIKRDKIVGHCDLDNRKTCPNFDVSQKLKEWE